MKCAVFKFGSLPWIIVEKMLVFELLRFVLELCLVKEEAFLCELLRECGYLTGFGGIEGLFLTILYDLLLFRKLKALVLFTLLSWLKLSFEVFLFIRHWLLFSWVTSLLNELVLSFLVILGVWWILPLGPFLFVTAVRFFVGSFGVVSLAFLVSYFNFTLLTWLFLMTPLLLLDTFLFRSTLCLKLFFLLFSVFFTLSAFLLVLSLSTALLYLSFFVLGFEGLGFAILFWGLGLIILLPL